MKPVIKNRRLLIRKATDGTKKLAVNDTGGCGVCTTCESNLLPCNSGGRCFMQPGGDFTIPWVDGGEDPLDPGVCCFPNTFFFKLSGSSASGDCSTLRGWCFGDGTTLYRGRKWGCKPTGTLDCSGCLTFAGMETTSGTYVGGGINYDDLVSITYYGVLPGKMEFDTYFTSTRHDSTASIEDEPAGDGCTDYWQTRHVKVNAVLVFVQFKKPTTPGGKWQVAAMMRACDYGGLALYDDPTIYDEFTYAPENRPSWFVPVVLWATAVDIYGSSFYNYWSWETGQEVDKCMPGSIVEFSSGVTNWNFPSFDCFGTPEDIPMPHWEGGTVTLKPCCDVVGYDCNGNTFSTYVWYKALRCFDSEPQEIWAREDWIKWDGRKSGGFRQPSGVCVYFDKDHSEKRTVPPDATPDYWTWAQVFGGGSKNCDFCSSFIQAIRCDTGEYIDAWTDISNVYLGSPFPGGPPYIAHTFTILFEGETICVRYESPAALPDGATIIDPIDFFDNCDHCNKVNQPPADCPTIENCPNIESTYTATLIGSCGLSPVTLGSNHNTSWGGSNGTDSAGLSCSGGVWTLTYITPTDTLSYQKDNHSSSTCDVTGTYNLVSGSTTCLTATVS